MNWKEDTFQYSWNDLSICVVLPFALLRQVLLREFISRNLSIILITPLWPQKAWFADLFSLLMDVPFELPML